MEKVWRKHRQHGDYGEHVNDRKHQPDDLTLFAPAYLSVSKDPLGMPSFQKRAVFLNIVQKAFDHPPPFI